MLSCHISSFSTITSQYISDFTVFVNIYVSVLNVSIECNNSWLKTASSSDFLIYLSCSKVLLWSFFYNLYALCYFASVLFYSMLLYFRLLGSITSCKQLVFLYSISCIKQCLTVRCLTKWKLNYPFSNTFIIP